MKDPFFWWVAFMLLMFIGAFTVGVVKFMAWWNVAFGGVCA